MIYWNLLLYIAKKIDARRSAAISFLQARKIFGCKCNPSTTELNIMSFIRNSFSNLFNSL